MIIKPYTQSLYLEALQALLKRLPRNHPKFQSIFEELNRTLAGSYGEEVTMTALKKVVLPYNFYIFHDLTLVGDNLFQIDVLIITPSRAIIFEVKNIKGDIEFQSSPYQMVRTLPNGEKTTFESPEIQLKEAIHQLTFFFKKHQINLPVTGALIIPFASSHVTVPPMETKLLFKNEIRQYLRDQIHIPTISADQLTRLQRVIRYENRPFHPFPLSNHFSIPSTHLRKGAICDKCSHIGMKKITRNWLCTNCQAIDKKAHIRAIREYFLIFKATLTNQDCREYLCLQTKHQAYRIMKSLHLEKQGTFRNATYKKSPLHREDP